MGMTCLIRTLNAGQCEAKKRAKPKTNGLSDSRQPPLRFRAPSCLVGVNCLLKAPFQGPGWAIIEAKYVLGESVEARKEHGGLWLR